MPEAFKTAIHQRLREAKSMGWLNVVPVALAAFFLFLAFSWLGFGVDGLVTHATGIEGKVTVTGCEPHRGRSNAQVGWDCVGVFHSHDGKTTIEGVAIAEILDEQPVAPVAAVVPGEKAATAYSDSGPWLAQFAFGLLGLVGTGYFIWWWYRPRTKMRKSRKKSGAA